MGVGIVSTPTMPSIELPSGLVSRRELSAKRLEAVRGAVAANNLHNAYPSIVVYATGSLGRGEAGAFSDLDIFCVDVSAEDRHLGKLDSIRLFNALINVNEASQFPSFSGDGRFLDIHRIEDILKFLGTRDDDYRNLFTARMLLLLESQVLVGSSAYICAVEKVIDLYWRDCTNEATFKPTFLINDLVRYWRTLCLTHEADRSAADQRTDRDKRRRRVAVLKLKFNRAWMIFNGLVYLLSGFEGEGVPRSHVERLVDLLPVERTIEIGERLPNTSPYIQALLDEYAWFLEQTDREKEEIEEFFADDSNYETGRLRGEVFCDCMARLVDEVAKTTPIHRHLLI
jgi:hypothetical protein